MSLGDVPQKLDAQYERAFDKSKRIKDLEERNEKLKKALEIAKLKLKAYSARDRWNHYGSTPNFILWGSEENGYDIAERALKEIEEVLK